MPGLEDFQDITPSGNDAMDAALSLHLEHLADIQRGAELPEGEPDKSRKDIETLVDTIEIPADNKKKIKDLIALSKQVSPPGEAGADGSTGKPFIDPDATA